MIPASWRFAVAAAALVAAFAAGWQVSSWRWRAADAERIKTEARDAWRRVEHADAAAGRAEVRSAAIRAQVRTITRRVDVIVERPIYRTECLDADGLALVRAAAAGDAVSVRDDGAAASGAPGEPASAVPGPDAAR